MSFVLDQSGDVAFGIEQDRGVWRVYRIRDGVKCGHDHFSLHAAQKCKNKLFQKGEF